ncbi:hypothetical protein [Bdellovibrio sp. HCB288]|uniref:hypothetical protein n=1 Tax=Bdellovibrio sp. HCB288 TaxID=3394355 RepID=UPI0039B5DA43
MKQLFKKNKIIVFVLFMSQIALGQDVTPLAATTILPTTAASPVVTAPVTTTTTTTTVGPTMMDLYLQQVAAQQTAAAEQATAAATAQARSQQLAAGIQLAMKACPFFQAPEATKIKVEGQKIQEAIGRDSDKGGNQDPTVSEQDQKQNRESKSASSVVKSCDSFIKDDGEYGSLGNKVLAGVRENADAFSEKVPKDMKSLCPKYASMDSEQRNKFWVWAMMSMASTESSCDSEQVNENAPHGAAVGLFQLSGDVCGKEVDLKNAISNADCAVKRLAKELKSRPNFISSSAVSEDGTYWAAICVPKKGSKDCGENGNSSKKTISMIRQFSGCGYKAKPTASKTAKK